MSKETPLMQRIRLYLGKVPSIKLFRNNVGTGWVGRSRSIPGGIQIMEPRRLDAGLIEGSSDLIGWTVKTVTPEMVGTQVAIFTAVEVKSSVGTASKEQVNFIFQVRKAGGISGLVRDEDDAKKLFNL